MKSRSLVLPLVFAALVLGVFFFTDVSKFKDSFGALSGSNGIPQGLSDTYDDKTLAFSDPVLGYSVRYPIGYPLQAQDGQSVTFFAPGPSGLSESFVWQTVNESYSANELKQIGLDELFVTPVSEQTISVSGKSILRFQYLVPKEEFGEPLHVVQGLVPCGNYSLYYVASIPESLKDDLNLADYALYSAKCGSGT